MPMKCTACCAATATCKPRESAKPTSSDARIDEPARDEQRILAAFEHARQPVDAPRRDRCARIDLDERADRVVVRVAALVVERAAPLHRLLDVSRVIDAMPSAPARGRGELERVERRARVAVGQPDESVERVAVERDAASRRARARSRPARGRRSRPISSSVSCFKHEDARARQQRGVHFERRVLGRRADRA